MREHVVGAAISDLRQLAPSPGDLPLRDGTGRETGRIRLQSLADPEALKVLLEVDLPD